MEYFINENGDLIETAPKCAKPIPAQQGELIKKFIQVVLLELRDSPCEYRDDSFFSLNTKLADKFNAISKELHAIDSKSTCADQDRAMKSAAQSAIIAATIWGKLEMKVREELAEIWKSGAND